jgi:hypothetical protein
LVNVKKEMIGFSIGSFLAERKGDAIKSLKYGTKGCVMLIARHDIR